jgi:hypothetical protein
MTELRRRILDPDISAQERDILCEASFGKPFSEAVHEMRLDDLTEGVEAGDYFILSVSGVNDMSMTCDFNPCAFEVSFGFARPYALNELRMMSMLYTVDPPAITANDMYRSTNVRFYATLYGTDAFKWAVTQIKKLQTQFRI